MGYCPNCGKRVFTPYDSVCSEACEKDYQVKTIKLNRVCDGCGGDIVVNEGFYVMKKKVYCSAICLTK